MISVNEKVGHLASVKSKLESTLGELESGLDKGKKSRATVEKQKRKLEGDLKMAQDSVVELERTKRDVEVTIANKEKNNAQLAAKLDDEQNLVAKAQKGIKEIQGRVEAMEEKREAEVNKLRKDVEEANIQQESILSNLKRKQGDATAEMTEQIDALGKMKSKIEKDKVLIMNEIADARAATDEVMRAQASADMSNKKMLET